MSPLQLEILMFYGTRAGDYRDGDFSAGAVHDAVLCFKEDEILASNPTTAPKGVPQSKLILTAKGAVWFETIMLAASSVPLPVKGWVIPSSAP